MSNVEGYIAAELARTLHRQAPASLLGGLAIAATLVATVWNTAAVEVLAFWVTLHILTSLVRLMLWYHYRGRLDDEATADAWRSRMTWTLLVSGLIWGVGAWLFCLTEQPSTLTAVIIIFSVLIAGAIGSLAAVVSTYILYSLPVAIIVAFRMFESAQFLAVHSVGFLIYVLVCFQYARNLQQNIIEATRLRYEREALVSELTDRSRLLSLEAARADAASEAKSKFLAVASHDLAQPMHALELFMNALSKERDGTKRDQLITRATESTKVMSEMLASLLDLSRLESEVITPSRQLTSLQSLTDILEREFRPQIEGKGLTLDYEVPDYTINTDPVLLQRMLRNLLNNAMQYTDSGSIRLSAELAADHVELLVEDTGAGMTTAEIERVFDEHYQGSGSTGLGLGLSLVRGFADLLGIDIKLDSEPGKGSVFHLLIPLESVAPESASDDEMVSVPKGLNVLLLEDDEPTRFAISVLLEQWQANLVAGASWREVSDQLAGRSFKPDVVLSDYHLSEHENALDILDHLRTRFEEVPPVVVVTGNRSSELAETLARLGVAQLAKPVSFDELEAVILSVLDA